MRKLIFKTPVRRGGIVNKDNESELNQMQDVLHIYGWTYKGCDEWEDPVTGIKHPTSTAYQILEQRDKEKRAKQ
jgi:hypothetical protein